jgi:hypothetical protein
VSLVICGLVLVTPRPAAAQYDHQWWAVDLISNVSPVNNSYGSASEVSWAGVNGANSYSNNATCSSFLTKVLRQAYGWASTDILYWLGSSSPVAAIYHDAIVEENGFEIVPTVADLQAGDIMAIRYPEGSSVSGHVAIARGAANPRAATAPVVEGTWQFDVMVIDSTSSAHGWQDTRRQADGGFDAGAGMGVMRLYTNDDLEVVGYTWSTLSVSVYRDVSTHHMIIGRLL